MQNIKEWEQILKGNADHLDFQSNKNIKDFVDTVYDQNHMLKDKNQYIWFSSNKLKDTSASIMLQWFITEQVEEEKNASLVLEKLKLVSSSSPALLMLNAELGKREGG